MSTSKAATSFDPSLPRTYSDSWREAYGQGTDTPRLSSYQAPDGEPVVFAYDSISLGGGQNIDTVEYPFGFWSNTKLGEEVFRDIEIYFKRNIPEDTTAIINMINSLKGSVSDATLLAQLPFISDVNAELEALQAQKESNMELYSFTAPTGDEEEEGDTDGTKV